MPTAVLYARVSDHKQAEADVSIPAQVAACEKRAAELGASVLRVFRDEGRSAFHGRRPQFEAAIEMAATLRANYFITWSSSRFARNRVDASLNKQLLDRAGVKIVFLDSNVDRDSEAGWVFDAFSEILDEMYSRKTRTDREIMLRSVMRCMALRVMAPQRVPPMISAWR